MSELQASTTFELASPNSPHLIPYLGFALKQRRRPDTPPHDLGWRVPTTHTEHRDSISRERDLGSVPLRARI